MSHDSEEGSLPSVDQEIDRKDYQATFEFMLIDPKDS